MKPTSARLFELGRNVNFALPPLASTFRPSAMEVKSAANKLSVSIRDARRALDYYNFHLNEVSR